MTRFESAIFLLATKTKDAEEMDEIASKLEKRKSIVETSVVPGMKVKREEYDMMVRVIGSNRELDKVELMLKNRSDFSKVARLTAEK
ncbi:MAG: hypothetical protein KGH59_01565 [Candidatus Micrarchaeota archaeon]|nr:hypothetical protein [Candidatus Micrarchaeota archaeon]